MDVAHDINSWQRSLRILTVAASPISLTEMKNRLRVWHDADDSDIQSILDSVWAEAESRTGRMARAFTAELRLSRFPWGDDPIVLPRPPLTAVSSVQYTDAGGTLQTLSGWQPDLYAVPGTIRPPVNQVWPVTRQQVGAVIVTFAGGATPPKEMLTAVRLLVETEYHDMSPDKMLKMQDRAQRLLHGLSIRDPRLAGIST